MTISSRMDQRHIYINWQSYREAVNVGNKVISQNNIQKIANIAVLQRVLFIKLVSQCKTERNIKVNTGNLSVRSRNLRYCAKVMQTIINKKKCLFWSLAIYCRYISKTFHGYDRSARYPYNLRDISSRYRSSETSLQQYLDQISRRLYGYLADLSYPWDVLLIYRQ